MSSTLLRSALLIAAGLAFNFLLTSSPLMMTSSAPPAAASPWADGPMKLVPTPQHETGKTDIFTTGATHMCLLHNAILRGYNSIYHQASRALPSDTERADFIGYCLTWHKFVKSHHDDEEAVLFTKVEELLGDKTVWAETHKEHEAFLQGLTDFHTYLSTLPSPKSFSGAKLLSIMSSFAPAFESHFRNEIATIASLASHPNAPKEGTPEAEAAAATFKSWGKSTVTKAGTLDVVPFFLLNLDRSDRFEGGMWANWPPMPAPVRWGLVNIAGAWHGGWWRFASCDGAGQPRELYALKFPEAKE